MMRSLLTNSTNSGTGTLASKTCTSLTSEASDGLQNLMSVISENMRTLLEESVER